MSQPKPPNPYFKYSNMAFQMVAIIGLSVFGGQKLDAWFNNSLPIYTIVLSLLGIGFALYLVLKDLIFPKK
ncbi:MAG: AtpZ/AtpI family protein [bacterium]|nr:AtpZ/AtpI family protein [bacterium]